MRWLATLAAGLSAWISAAGCGVPPTPSAPPAPAVRVAAPSQAPAAPPPTPLPPLDASLPSGSVALAGVDFGKLDAPAGAALRALDAEARAALEQGLHLGAGALADGRLARALAVDPGRPLQASLSITGGGKALIERLRALAGQPPSPAIADELRRAFEGARGVGLWVRVVVPSTDPGVTLGVAATLLSASGWAGGPPPEGVDELYVDRRERALAGLTRGASAVVVDLVAPAAGTESEPVVRAGGLAMLAAIRARAPGGPHDEPLPLDGAIARARYAPATLADVGFLQGVSATARALAGASVDDAQRGELAAAGLREAAQSYRLAGDGRGAFFDRVELWIEGGYGAIGGGLRAAPGPATQLAGPAWAPAAALALPGAFATLDISIPWLRSWTILGKDPMEAKELQEAVREAGLAGTVVALPQVLAGGSWEPMRWFSRRPGLLERLERVAVFAPKENGTDGFVGLFAAGTAAADAACALEEPSTPCAADKKLRPGVVAQHGGRSVELLQIKGRWAILVSTDKGVVEAARPELLAASGAVRFELPGGGPLAKELKPLPAGLLSERYVAEASLEGGQAVLRVRPARAPQVAAAPRR